MPRLSIPKWYYLGVPTDDIVLSIRIPPDLHEDAKALALREDRSLNQLIRVALRQYVDAGR